MLRVQVRIVLVAMLFLLSSERLSAQQIQVRGVQSCGEWVKVRKANEASFERAWLIGLLSGIAIGTSKNFWENSGANYLDNESVYLWMDKYCNANPLKNMGDGAVVLFAERVKGLR